MVFTKLLLENALAIGLCNCGAASEPLLPKVARYIPVLSSRYMGQCAASVLKCSAFYNYIIIQQSSRSCRGTKVSLRLCLLGIRYFQIRLDRIHSSALVRNWNRAVRYGITRVERRGEATRYFCIVGTVIRWLLLLLLIFTGSYHNATAIPRNSDPHPKSTKMQSQKVLKCDPKSTKMRSQTH